MCYMLETGKIFTHYINNSPDLQVREAYKIKTAVAGIFVDT